MIDVSIIIVNYKTPEYLRRCVQSLVDNTRDISIEIIVVDNNSQDDSEQIVKSIYPDAVWINSGYNAGFSRANNMGIRIAKGRKIILMNSDAWVSNNVVKIMYDEFETLSLVHKIGFLGCQVRSADDTLQYNSNLSFPSAKDYYYLNPILSKVCQVQKKSADNNHIHMKSHESMWLGMVCVMFDALLYREGNQLLDEDFFMYSEDVEWCYRLQKLGYKHFFSPACYVYHVNSGSSTIKINKQIQVALSHWLLLMKMYGKVRYITFIILILSNYITTNIWQILYLFRSKQQWLTDAIAVNKFNVTVLKTGGFNLLIRYGTKPSSHKKYLKYDV